jgi:hypothetical protein
MEEFGSYIPSPPRASATTRPRDVLALLNNSARSSAHRSAPSTSSGHCLPQAFTPSNSASNSGPSVLLHSDVRLTLQSPMHANLDVPDPPELLQIYRDWSRHRLCDPSLFEVRAVPALCKVNEPTQLGVFYIGQDPLPVNQRLLFFSAHWTHRSFYEGKDRSMTAYSRQLSESRASLFLDGKPKAMQYKRYIASSPAGLDWVNNLPASAFEPTQDGWSDGQRRQFREEPVGFMVNSPHAPFTANVKAASAPACKALRVKGAPVPFHQVTREIKHGDEVLVKYRSAIEQKGFQYFASLGTHPARTTVLQPIPTPIRMKGLRPRNVFEDHKPAASPLFSRRARSLRSRRGKRCWRRSARWTKAGAYWSNSSKRIAL